MYVYIILLINRDLSWEMVGILKIIFDTKNDNTFKLSLYLLKLILPSVLHGF